MTDVYESERNKIICKELVSHYLDHILATNNNIIKLLWFLKKEDYVDYYFYVDEQDYDREYFRVKANLKCTYISPSNSQLFELESQEIEKKFKASNPTFNGNFYINFVRDLGGIHTRIKWNDGHIDCIAEEIRKLPNYEELSKLCKIEKRAASKVKEVNRKQKAKITEKATNFNLSDQKHIVSTIVRIFQSKEQYKNHPLTYFFNLYNNNLRADEIDKTGEKLSNFLLGQLDEDSRDELVRDLLASYSEAAKRFCMVFDKSNAIVGALDNDEFIRGCANFLLEEKKNENNK